MKKIIIIVSFLFPFVSVAQGGIKAFRLSINAFVNNVIVDNSDGVFKPKFSTSTISSGVGLGLRGEIVFKLSSKLDIATGIGFEFRNYKNVINNFFSENDKGNARLLVGSVESNFQVSFYIPITLNYSLSQSSAISLGLNPYFRVGNKADIYTTWLDGSNRELWQDGATLQYKSFNINLQAAYTHKIALENNKSLLIKPYLGYLILPDGLFVNYGSNHFWDYGISLGIEFGNGETEEKKGKPKKKRR